MIDTHCHLTFDDYAGRVDEVLADAEREGVSGAITISTTARDAPAALDLARRFPNIWCSAGVHPLYSDQGPHDWEAIRRVAADERCVAWGELGLDNHYDRPARAVQREVLDEELAFIESCLPEIDLPVVLHCREAFADLVPILSQTKIKPERFVFHCFTGTPEDMRLLLDFGAHVSFTGVVTYRNAPEVREAALLAPLERIMVETDAPFLTPEPHRKVKPNEPKFAMATARFLAHLRGEAWEDFHNAINRTTEKFFGIGPVG